MKKKQLRKQIAALKKALRQAVARPSSGSDPVQRVGKVEGIRLFDWPLSAKDLQAHAEQFQKREGIYAPDFPAVMRFEQPGDEWVHIGASQEEDGTMVLWVNGKSKKEGK